MLLAVFGAAVVTSADGAQEFRLLAYCGPSSPGDVYELAQKIDLLKEEKQKGATVLCLGLNSLAPEGAFEKAWKTLTAGMVFDCALPGRTGTASLSPEKVVCSNLETRDGTKPFPAQVERNGVVFLGAVGGSGGWPEGWKAEAPPPGPGKAEDHGRPRVLLCSGTEEEALLWAGALAADLVLLASCLERTEPAMLGGIPFVYVPTSGNGVAAIDCSFEGQSVAAKVTLSRPETIAPELKRALPDFADTASEVKEPASPAPTPGSSFAVRNAQERKGVEVTVKRCKVSRRFALEEKTSGVYCLLQVSWKNNLPYRQVKDALHPVAYRIDALVDHAFLYCDGRHAVSLGKKENTALGAKPQVLLPERGTETERTLVFALPQAPQQSLEFVFLDERRGTFRISIWGAPPREASFSFKENRNPYLEFGVVSVEEKQEEMQAEAGIEPQKVLYTVELAGRSVLQGTFEDEPCGFIVHFSPRPYVRLVENELFSYEPVETEAPFGFHGQQTFLPRLYHHGTLAFHVPKTHGPLSLAMFMPAKRSVQKGTLTEEKPEPVAIDLGGGRAQTIAAPEALRTITDGSIVRVTLFPPRETKTQIVLEAEVENTADDVEIFRPFEQLHLQADGMQHPPSQHATGRLLRGAVTFVRLMPGGKRRFSLAYTQKGFGIVYRGFTRAEFTPFPGKTPPASQATTEAAAGQAARAHRQTGPGAIPVERKKLVATSPAGAGRKPPAPQGLGGVKLSPEKVNEAIEKGAAYLAGKILSGKTGFVGYDYIAAYAVLHSKLFRSNAQLASQVIDLFRTQPAKGTYSTALRMMGLRALDPASNRRLISRCASYLVSCQSTDGMWEYGPTPAEEAQEFDSGLVVIGGRPVAGLGAQLELVRESIPLERDEVWRSSGGDFSCTQYAALGLKAAEESGIKVPQQVWREMAEVVAEGQASDGGWNYGAGGSWGYGSMTVAGFATYLIACHYAGTEPEKEVVQRGYDWISKYFSVKENPGASKWVYYYLYGLERAGMISDLALFGVHEWYPLLAKELVETQKDDGSWLSPDRSDPVLDTAFALLCLSRATIPLNVKPLSPEGGRGTLVTGRKGAPHILYIIFDASRSMRASFGAGTRLEAAKKTLSRLVKGLPAATVVALRVFGARTRPNHPDANKDSLLLVPPVQGSREAVPEVVNLIKASGRTPLSLSLAQTAEDLQKLSEERKVTVLLLADGEESDPRAHPSAASYHLMQRPNTELFVVGLGTDETATACLKKIADAGRGVFFYSEDASQLNQAIEKGVWRNIPFVIRDRFGKQSGTGFVGEEMQLAEGKYEIGVTVEGRTYVRPFWINSGKHTMVLFSRR